MAGCDNVRHGASRACVRRVCRASILVLGEARQVSRTLARRHPNRRLESHEALLPGPPHSSGARAGITPPRLRGEARHPWVKKP